MKTFTAVTGATIVCPIQNTSSIFRSFRAMGRLLLAVLISGLLAQHIYCQGFDEKPLTDFFHGTHFLSMNGDTMTFEVVLGSEDAPAANVAGFEIAVSFPSLNYTPSQVYATVNGSWVAAGASNTNVTNAYDPTTAQLEFAYLRDDESGQTGDGRVAKIYLVRSGGFVASEAVISIDGGLIIIDNVDLRIGQFPGPSGFDTHAPEMIEPVDADPIADGLLVYPGSNPELLGVAVSNPEACELRLTTMAGTVVRKQTASSAQEFDLAGLAAGIYIVSLQSETRFVSQKVFIR